MGKEKIFKTAITCILIGSLCLSGCGVGTPDQDTETKNSEAVESGADSTQPIPSSQPTPSPQPATPEEYNRAPMPLQYIPEGREVVTLGTFGSVRISSPMYKSVNAFNQAQEKYFVSIEVYSSLTRFFTDIVRKQGTDLYDLDVGTGVDVLVNKGVLEDLTPYFESSGAVGRDDILDTVWRAGSVDDKLYFLIPCFQCNGILVEKSYTKEGAWSGRDFLELGKKYPGSMLTQNIQNPSSLLLTELREYMSAFINWKDRTCSFDSDEFIALLEDIKALSSYDYEAVDESDTLADQIHGKTYLTEWVRLNMDSGMSSYRNITDAFGNSYEIAGMPSADGSLKYGLLYDQIYGMNVASGNKEGAWAFLEYLVSEDSSSLLNGNFPARKDLLEQGLQVNIDYVKDPDGVITYHINRYTGEKIEGFGGFTEEDAKDILHIIDNTYRQTFEKESTLIGILLEETAPFFQGQKSAKDVAKIIQSRVSLYVIE